MNQASKTTKNKNGTSGKQHAPSRAFRSKITNGSALLENVDGRTTWARRFRDLIEAHTQDKGGEGHVSEGEKALIRRAACLIVELEHMEAGFALNDGGDGLELERYQRMVNTLRRALESLGLQRRPRPIDVTGTIIDAIRSDCDSYGTDR